MNDKQKKTTMCHSNAVFKLMLAYIIYYYTSVQNTHMRLVQITLRDVHKYAIVTSSAINAVT